YGMSAITALTAQNTRGVQGIHEVPAEFVGLQMDSAIADIGVDAMKTGMLSNSSIIRMVSRKVRQYRVSKVVVDPVMVAKGGARLLSPEAEGTLKKELIPLAQIITPNIPEAEFLARERIRGVEGMRKAARQLLQMGARNVLIKGGHLRGDPVDVFFDGRSYSEFSGPRLPSPHTHGTGCTLSAVIALELARGNAPKGAVEKAKAFVASAIQFSFPLGEGIGPVNHYTPATRDGERYRVIQGLKMAFHQIQERKVGHLFPEVQSNLGYAGYERAFFRRSLEPGQEGGPLPGALQPQGRTGLGEKAGGIVPFLGSGTGLAKGQDHPRPHLRSGRCGQGTHDSGPGPGPGGGS
ncbi:MAG: phosphomethylpyrimidine kinase, partial [Deltaproteobacteria bacterium]|nr:phosphomethylpyrimidine kinase [Deltaproteobacteria bacterium]